MGLIIFVFFSIFFIAFHFVVLLIFLPLFIFMRYFYSESSVHFEFINLTSFWNSLKKYNLVDNLGGEAILLFSDSS